MLLKSGHRAEQTLSWVQESESQFAGEVLQELSEEARCTSWGQVKLITEEHRARRINWRHRRGNEGARKILSLFSRKLGEDEDECLHVVEARTYARSEALKLNLAGGRRLRRPRDDESPRPLGLSLKSIPRLHGCIPLADRISTLRRDSLSFSLRKPLSLCATRKSPLRRFFRSSNPPREVEFARIRGSRPLSPKKLAEVILRRIKIQAYSSRIMI